MGKPVAYREVEFDDQVYKLACVSPGRNFSDSEKMKIAELICKMYATDEYTIADCCKYCGVRSRTFYRWVDEMAEMAELYTESQQVKSRLYRTTLKERARTTAERLLDGYTIEVEERELEQIGLDRSKNKDGEESIIVDDPEMMITKRIKRKQVYVRPSAKLAETVLFNLDKENFKRNPEQESDLPKDVNLPPINWVK